jgi:DDE superfamily endonuclease
MRYIAVRRLLKFWLNRHPRFKMHYTPTSSSWLNLVERFFADLTEDVIRSGSFGSVGELVRDINAYQRLPAVFERALPCQICCK